MNLLNLFNFLKPAKYLPEVQEEEVVKQQYKYWRWRIFYGMYAGYVFYYLTRKSFTFAMPALMKDLGFTKGDLGFLVSVLSLTYGLSKFLSGIVADRSNPRYFMALGLILTGVFNIFFGLSSTIVLFAIFWGLNGWFQGWGWPPCARLLTHWYSHKELGTWWGFWSTAHSVGGAIIPVMAAVAAQYLGWRYSLYIPGVLSIVGGLFIVNRLRDTPQSLGLPPIEKFKNDYPEQVKASNEHELSVKEILVEYVLKNRYIWVLAISYFFVYMIRTGINDWTVLYLVEVKKYSLITAGTSVAWFEVGGIVGSFVAGWASDKLFKGKRGPINVIFCLVCMFAVASLWFSQINSIFIDSAILFAVGVFVFGPQMLIGVAAAELSHKKASATATGFIGWVAYLGAASAGYPLGKVTQIWGWEGFFLVMGVCGLLSTLLLVPLWGAKTHPKYSQAKEETEELVPAPSIVDEPTNE